MPGSGAVLTALAHDDHFDKMRARLILALQVEQNDAIRRLPALADKGRRVEPEMVAAVDVQGGWTKEVWKVDWEGCGYAVPGLDDSQVVLVDTPGVNDMNDARAEITYGYIPQSDAILFLLDAGQILKESERQFVASKLLAASRDKV